MDSIKKIVIFIYRRFIKCIHDFAYFIMDRELKYYNYLLVTESYLIQVRGFPEESADLIPPFFFCVIIGNASRWRPLPHISDTVLSTECEISSLILRASP